MIRIFAVTSAVESLAAYSGHSFTLIVSADMSWPLSWRNGLKNSEQLCFLLIESGLAHLFRAAYGVRLPWNFGPVVHAS